MSKTVFVLGAGASRAAGGPLMSDFLDTAERLMRSGEVDAAKQSFELVFSGIAALQAVHSKSTLDLDNIESVFAAFEMAMLFGRLGRSSGIDVAGLAPAIRRVIVSTLEQTVRCRVASTGDTLPPECYDNFAQLLKEMEEGEAGSVSVMTFNYDLGLDHGLYWTRTPIDYCLDATPSRALPVMKLHGSINWGRCSECEQIAPWTLPEFFSKYHWPHRPEPGQRRVLGLSSELKVGKHCDTPVASEPFIVPPTWSKGEHHRQIAPVWRHAARHLSEAENIVCIGYSLPESDHFFRYLYGLGTVSDTRLKRFWVFDPDTRGGVPERYERMLEVRRRGAASDSRGTPL